MMKVIASKEIENCFEGSNIRELLFDENISKSFILHFKEKGRLQYFPSFSRPFFKIDVKDKFIIKGVEGFKTSRIILKGDIEQAYNYFLSILNDFSVTDSVP